MQAAGGAIGAVTGGISNALGIGSQVAGAKSLALYNHNLQKSMWNYTNYENQVKHMKNAGLNVGLMYGSAGQSGQSSSATAGIPQQGTNHALQGMAMMQQAQLNQANIDLMKSQANKNNVEAKKTAEIDTEVAGATLDNILQSTENLKSNKTLTDLNAEMQTMQNNIKNKTQDYEVMGIVANADKAQSEARSALVQANIDEKTQETVINTIKQEYINMTIQATLMKANIKLTEAQELKVKEETKYIIDYVTNDIRNSLSNQQNANSNQRNSEVQLYRQIQDRLYQEGLIDLGDRKLNQDLIFGIIDIAKDVKMPTKKIGF